MTHTFSEAEDYIFNIPRFATKNSPEDTKRFLGEFGDISLSIPTIHIAGTNGKGSVCALLRDTFISAGYVPGVFTSPHLVSIRERFALGREMISEAEFIECFEKVLSLLESPKWKNTDYHPSYFEFLFFMSVVWFGAKKPDVLILETGLGGRLDATNSISKPVITVITEIGFDHMEYLGDSIAKIAGEKAGIIKENVPVVYVDKETSGEVIKKRADMLNAKAVPVCKNSIKNLVRTRKGIDFSLESHYYENVNLSVNSGAMYQAENAAVAFKTLEALGENGTFLLTKESIQQGFLNMYWPGRMEPIEDNIVLDGAHNEDGIKAFLESVKCDGAHKRCLLYSAVADKQIEKITDMIISSGLFDSIYLAPLSGARAASMERISNCFGKYEGALFFFNDVREAFDAMKSRPDGSEMRYVAGSLYLVGEIKEAIR